MRRLLLLATTLLALLSPSPAISNGWRQNPDDDLWTVILAEGLWHIKDENVGEEYLPRNVRLTTPVVNSMQRLNQGGWAYIATSCYWPKSTMIALFLHYKGKIYLPDTYPYISVKVNNGALQNLKVDREDVTIMVTELGVPTGAGSFFLRDEASDLLRRAMREELSVRVTIPIYQNVDEVFEWDMKGGAAAYKQACRTIRPEGRAHKRNSSGL